MKRLPWPKLNYDWSKSWAKCHSPIGGEGHLSHFSLTFTKRPKLLYPSPETNIFSILLLNRKYLKEFLSEEYSFKSWNSQHLDLNVPFLVSLQFFSVKVEQIGILGGHLTILNIFLEFWICCKLNCSNFCKNTHMLIPRHLSKLIFKWKLLCQD